MARDISLPDVFWAYKSLLGREPESTVCIQYWMSQGPFDVFLERFTQTDEFRAKAIARAIADAKGQGPWRMKRIGLTAATFGGGILLGAAVAGWVANNNAVLVAIGG